MPRSWPFVDWCVEADRLCRIHLGCSWADLAGDPEPLVAAFTARESPAEFVTRYHDRYDLQWLTPLRTDEVS